LGFDENFDLGALAIVVKGVLASVRGVNRCGGKDSEGEGCCQVVGGGAAGCVFFGRFLGSEGWGYRSKVSIGLDWMSWWVVIRVLQVI
jgi:hypothetical protein